MWVTQLYLRWVDYMSAGAVLVGLTEGNQTFQLEKCMCLVHILSALTKIFTGMYNLLPQPTKDTST